MSLREASPNLGTVTRRGLGSAGALTAGVLLATQSRINGELGARLGDGIAAATVSFGLGFLVLLIGTTVLPMGRRALRRFAGKLRSGELPWTHCLGGLCGGYLVFSQGVAAGVLGVALFTIAAVSGQVISGLLVDRWGIGPGGAKPVSLGRVFGGVLALIAVVIAVSSKFQAASVSGLILLPLLAGFGTGWQQAVNGRVRQAADSALLASTVNFATGTVMLVLVSLIKIAVVGLPTSAPSEIGLYCGGLLGIFVVGIATVVVRHTGVLVLSMGMVAGQLLGAGLLDLRVPAPGTSLEMSTVVGIVLTFVAVALAAWPSRAAMAA